MAHATPDALPPRLAAWRDAGQVLTISGRRVFVRDAPGPSGAPALLVLHGFPTSSFDFEAALELLTTRVRVIVHDHLGFGLSDKPAGGDYGYSLFEQADVALGVWRALGVDKAHLLAHDYGTSVATELMARRERGLLPLSVGSVTLCNGSVHLELAKLSWPQRVMRRPRLGPIFVRLASRRLFERRMRKLFGRPDAIDPGELGLLWQAITHGGGRHALAPLSRYLDERTRYRHRWIGALSRLDLPAHILWGRADPIAVPAIAEQLHREIPEARLTWLDALGHYPMLEDPRAWARAVLDGLPA